MIIYVIFRNYYRTCTKKWKLPSDSDNMSSTSPSKTTIVIKNGKQLWAFESTLPGVVLPRYALVGLQPRARLRHWVLQYCSTLRYSFNNRMLSLWFIVNVDRHKLDHYLCRRASQNILPIIIYYTYIPKMGITEYKHMLLEGSFFVLSMQIFYK